MNSQTEEEDHACTACGKSFESEAELERHVRDIGLVH